MRMKHIDFPEEGFKLIPADRKLEEETLNQPPSVRYYPAKIGEVFLTRYQIVTKLGFGQNSTVWLCQDMKHEGGRYLALKIYTASPHSLAQSREVVASLFFKNIEGVHHPGWELIRRVEHAFDIPSLIGRHVCLLYEPHGMPISKFRDYFPGKMLSKKQLQSTLVYTLMALDVLNQVNIVHTYELQRPSPRKILPNGTVIYASRPFPVTYGPTVITDFCHARYQHEKPTGKIMPDSYRAPEVILGMEWDTKVNVWSVGVMIWHLFEGGRLFYNEEDRLMEDEQHLAQMVSLMGPPPKHFLERSPKCRKYWDEDGKWIAATPIPSRSFALRENRLSPADLTLFLAFIHKIFRWDPHERASPTELVKDPFLAQCGIVKIGRDRTNIAVIVNN
ncbi:kinase-like domain-containing protein [Nemania serpens]|nr:kinase-like domain-containing protein [Nemania serpens]